MYTNTNRNLSSYRISKLSIVVIFIFLLATMRCWIGFEGRLLLMQLAFPVIMFIFYLESPRSFTFKSRYVGFSVLVALSLLLLIRSSLNLVGYINQILPAVGILLVVSINDEYKEYVFSKIIEWFGVLMVLSIPIYLFTLFVQLPSFGTIMADYGGSIIAGKYANYLFYICPQQIVGDVTFRRFNGPFIESGDVGCVAAFMLMAARFDFKRYKYLWAVLAGLILSFSLAGYMLVFFAYYTTYINGRKGKKYSFTLAIIITLGFYMFGTFYNGGDNLINEQILSRLQSDEERGFVGNNRTSLLKLDYFYAMFNDPQTIWFGYDKITIDRLMETGLGDGFVNQTLSVGLMGVLGLVLPFLYFTISSSSRKYAWLFFIFFLMYFFQRTETTWMSIVICYVYGIIFSEIDKINKNRSLQNER